MNFLADENVEFPIIKKLREIGFSVESIAEDRAGISDLEVIEYAVEKRLIIITLDKDFGEIVFKSKLQTNGIILLRLDEMKNKEKVDVIGKIFLENSELFMKSFTIITKDKIRIKSI